MNRILVIATRQIGDVLLTTPLVHAARRRWPQARIDVLGFEGQLGILQGNPDVDQCVATPARLGFLGFWRLVSRLWRRYDLALVSQPGDRAHLLGWIAAPSRSGLLPESGGSNWWKTRLLDHAVTAAGDRGEVHVVMEKLRLLDPWPVSGQAAAQVVTPAPRPLPAEWVATLRPAPVVVHVPSMWRYKQWPIEHFVKLVQGLLSAGHQVVLTGSSGPRDQQCIAALRAEVDSPDLIDASGKLDFGQLVTLLSDCALYIGPDTSITHLAAASGAAVLTLFGPTNPQRWAPWPVDAGAPIHIVRRAPKQTLNNITLLQGPQECVPCGRAGCEDHHHSHSACLESIAPDFVLAQAVAIMAKPNSSQAH
jgi:heptosyltransferase-3